MASIGETQRMGERISLTIINVWVIAIKNCQQIDITRIRTFKWTFLAPCNRTEKDNSQQIGMSLSKCADDIFYKGACCSIQSYRYSSC